LVLDGQFNVSRKATSDLANELLVVLPVEVLTDELRERKKGWILACSDAILGSAGARCLENYDAPSVMDGLRHDDNNHFDAFGTLLEIKIVAALISKY
jgi:hypothetical protein